VTQRTIFVDVEKFESSLWKSTCQRRPVTIATTDPDFHTSDCDNENHSSSSATSSKDIDTEEDLLVETSTKTTDSHYLRSRAKSTKKTPSTQWKFTQAKQVSFFWSMNSFFAIVISRLCLQDSHANVCMHHIDSALSQSCRW